MNRDGSLSGAMDRVPIGWLIVFIVALCLPPLVVSLSVRGPQNWMEGICLMTSQETWLSQASGDQEAWKTPTLNQAPRIKKPPLLVWTNMLAWSGLEPATVDWHQLVLRARLVTVALGLMLVLSTFWIGCVLSGRTLGTIAALACGLIPLTQGQARMASYDMHMVAWTTLAIAAAIWAIHPFGLSPLAGRKIGGWLLAAAALSIATLSKEPQLVALTFLIPVLAAIVLASTPRWGDLLWLLLPLIAFGGTWAAWYEHITSVAPEAEEKLKEEYSGIYTNDQPVGFYLKVLLTFTIPWTVWLIGGLIHPFSAPRDGRGHLRVLPWVWLVILVVAFSTNTGKASRYILPAAPAIGLLIGMVFLDYTLMARRGQRDPRARLLFIPHFALLLLASIALPIVLAFPKQIHETIVLGRRLTDEQEVAPIGALLALLIGAALLATAAFGWTMFRRWLPMHAAIATALWTTIATTAYRHGYAHAPNPMHEVEQGGSDFAAIVGQSPVRYLRLGDDCRPANEFFFFTMRTMKSERPEELAEFVAESKPPVYIMANAIAPHDEAMRAAGFEPVLDFNDSPNRLRRLWVHQ